MLMICGTDLSSASAEALGAAVAVAARRGEPRVLLAYVVEPGVAEASADELAAAVAAVQPAATAGGVTIENRVIRGDTATSLVALARSEHADMIVIGARGPAADSNADDERPPGVADRLAQITPVPVLVVRSAAPFRAWAAGTARLRAFLGADPSHTSAIAMAWAKQLVGRGGIDVVLGSIFYADEAGKQYGVRTTSMVDDDPELVRLINRDALRRWSAQAASAPGDGTVGAKARHGLGRIGDHLLELADADVTDINGNGRKLRHRWDMTRATASRRMKREIQATRVIPSFSSV